MPVSIFKNEEQKRKNEKHILSRSIKTNAPQKWYIESSVSNLAKKIKRIACDIENSKLKRHRTRFFTLTKISPNFENELLGTKTGLKKIELIKHELDLLECDLVDLLLEDPQGRIMLYKNWYNNNLEIDKQTVNITINTDLVNRETVANCESEELIDMLNVSLVDK